jgi:glycosyltransferase involved in cell wall biosynthesis
MHLLVVSHPCTTPINQQIYAELEQQTGWKISLIIPDRWKDEFGNTLEGGTWPGLRAKIDRVPVWKNGHIVLHVYKRNWSSFLRKNRFDAIYVHNEAYALAAAQICLANARTIKAPFGFYSAQNILKQYPPPFRWLERMVYNKSAYAFPITEAVEEVLFAKRFRGSSTVCALPLDPAIYRPRGADEDRRLIPRAEDEVVIGYVGRIVEPKGLRTLAAALPSLRDLRWKLVVIGKGDFEDFFQQLLADGGVADRATFLGFVPHEETPRYLSAFDTLVVPSETQPNWKEQFGRVITEAIACETPVVGSSSGEIPNLIRKSGGGLIFPERDPVEFAKTLRQILTQNDLREKLGETGRKWVEKEVSLSAVANKMAETFEKVTGSAAKRSHS